jgi:hypothetical protein
MIVQSKGALHQSHTTALAAAHPQRRLPLARTSRFATSTRYCPDPRRSAPRHNIAEATQSGLCRDRPAGAVLRPIGHLLRLVSHLPDRREQRRSHLPARRDLRPPPCTGNQVVCRSISDCRIKNTAGRSESVARCGAAARLGTLAAHSLLPLRTQAGPRARRRAPQRRGVPRADDAGRGHSSRRVTADHGR